MATECVGVRGRRSMSVGATGSLQPVQGGDLSKTQHAGFKRQELWHGLRRRLAGTPMYGGPLEELDDAQGRVCVPQPQPQPQPKRVMLVDKTALDEADDEDDGEELSDEHRYLAQGPRATERLRSKSATSMGARDSLQRCRGPSMEVSNSNSSAEAPSMLSDAQKAGCFSYIKRRHSIALAFASDVSRASMDDPSNLGVPEDEDASSVNAQGSNWEFTKVKNGVRLFRSRRSRCEVRGVTQVNASVKNVMAVLAAGESTEQFASAQKILLGHDQVLESRVLASCAPSTSLRFFHCGLKYQAMKNPFGVTPLDLVYLDYTDVSTTPDEKLIGFRILESIRVPELRPAPKYVRGSIRCEVYMVHETDVPGVVEVTFASHLDPKSKCSSSKRHHWLDQAAVRLGNLRAHAEKASFGHHVLADTSSKGGLRRRRTVTTTTERKDKEKQQRDCSVCQHAFSFLRKRHLCRLCGEASCGRCCRKLPMLVDDETSRVKVCLGCILRSRNNPDELGRTEIDHRPCRGDIGNSTFVIHDE